MRFLVPPSFSLVGGCIQKANSQHLKNLWNLDEYYKMPTRKFFVLYLKLYSSLSSIIIELPFALCGSYIPSIYWEANGGGCFKKAFSLMLWIVMQAKFTVFCCMMD